MAKFFLDTGILIGYIRGADYTRYVEEKYELFKPQNFCFVSVVTIGEIYSLSFQFGWGEKKVKIMKEILNKIPVIDINNEKIIYKYAEIDAFSQNKHPQKKMPGNISSRNMGKNDLWIAANASVLNTPLLTTDHHFDHLNKHFLEVIYIDIKLK
jgi:predicted nucleic acid-binding protein